MNKLINKYSYNALDSEELRLTKSLVIIVAASCSICGLIWTGFYSYILGFGLTAKIPLVFVAIVVPSIFISHFIGNYKLLVYAQLVCIVWVPALVQWSLGSISDSGFVIFWCFLGPIGALLFLDHKSAKRCMLMFLIIFCVTAIGFPPLSSDGEKVTENVRTVFYLMNIGAPSIVIFIASSHFLKNLNQQRKRNVSLLEIAEANNKKLAVSLEREKELGQLKTSFVSMASHQFKTPLAIIQSNAELYEMLANSGKIIEPEKYVKVTTRIVVAVASMTNLIDEVLVLGNLTSGNVTYTPENVDLIGFCEKLTEEFNLVQQDGRVLDFVTIGEAYRPQLDPKLLGHSLSNLISNAFKYSAGKENPQLSIHFKPTEVVLSVKDYGLGIPEEEQLHLFEPFFRADNAINIQGTGLGLSIAKEYIEVNKGSITYTSILGGGSCFEMTFKT
jgi:signal transduction histidine kinase